MFGFQYIPVQELDRILYGNTITGEAYFRHNLALLGTLFDYITDTYPEKSFKVSVETRKDGLSMDVWVEVLNYFDDQPTVDGFKLLSSDEEFKAPSTSKIEYYSISLENNVNGETVDSAVLLDPSEPSTNKCWMVLASFTPHTELSQKILVDKYNKFRNFQRTYFKKDSVDDGARNENSFASFLRNLSKASAHSNAIDQEYADRYYKRC
ncbi:mRNA degradation protein [Zancudomyces culisetae]|uniref:mRNA degradation protein n=1 Tax=Zancudomyces culisetae TaxID=1213189 RepID=A0A1R1PIP7_ZANCU|nr:mRNA degradation protein [Zancudomyces culisetae]OMH80823.1 mRNA degradation protein [Zancudomyces culisetae]OMH80885.1 mRNA degradation protein [Zancudomyces culisetae]|eukprot:OMH79001.1 mRNA degradation protein [Zancudomyces culisetae]